jgi:predicted nucleic acid-binding protein
VKKVFADTGYWVSIVNRHDELHAKAKDACASLGPHLQVTSEMVLTELAAFFSVRGAQLRQAVVELIRSIRANPNIRVVPQTSLQFQDALALYEQSSDKEWSLTDCASFLVMRELGITEALAYDEHFGQAGFVALLRH